MVFHRLLLICLCTVGAVSGRAQLEAPPLEVESDWYITWGYNRSMYTMSTVHMWGTGPTGQAFDVTLHDVTAKDMPERFQAKVYFHPGLFTIPQFNARFGKRIRERWIVSAGWDHMKYKLEKQWMHVDGYAAAADFLDEAPAGAELAWAGDSLYWGQGFNFEHSDGLNFVRFSLEHEHVLWAPRGREFSLRMFEAVGAGVVVCSTDFRWAGERYKNPQHISGLGMSLHAGFRANVHRRFFIQTTAQFGAVTLPWIRVQGPTDAGATQRFGFAEAAFALGYRIGASRRPNGN